MTGTAWQRLSDLGACRVTQIPRRSREAAPDGRAAADRDPGRPQRLAALASAYHAGISRHTDAGPIAVGWVRAVAGGPVEVLLAGSALRGSTSPARLTAPAAGEVSLALPAGGRGHIVAPGGMAAAMNALPCWTRIGGITDGLLAGDDGADQADRASLEEGLLAAWDGPFGWLILADPAGPGRDHRLRRAGGRPAAVSGGHGRPGPGKGRAGAPPRTAPHRATPGPVLRPLAAARAGRRGRTRNGRARRRPVLRLSGSRRPSLHAHPFHFRNGTYRRTPRRPARRTRASPDGSGCGVPLPREHRAAGGSGAGPRGRGARRPADPAPGIRRDPGTASGSGGPGVPAAPGYRAGPQRHPGRAPVGAAGLAQPARVRLRGDRGGEIADRAGTAGGGIRRGPAVAGRRAGQGRVPADERAAERNGAAGWCGSAPATRTRSPPGSTPSRRPPTRRAGGSRCRPTPTWSARCSWRRSPRTSRSRRCCRPR